MSAQNPATLAEPISALPSEIQLMIQEHIIISLIGNHTIHISGGWVGKRPNNVFKAIHYICKAKDTSTSTGNTPSPSPSLTNDDDHAKPYKNCRYSYKRNTENSVDTSIMTVSRVFHALGTRLLYSTNKFSFSGVRELRTWLSSIPPPLQAYIQHIRLDIRFSQSENAALWERRVPQWRQYFTESDLQTQIPNSRSLELEIEVDGFVSCWRKAQGRDATEMFRLFGGLRGLRDVDVVVRERLICGLFRKKVLNCDLRVHEGRHHAMDVRESEEERRKIRGEWAREIKGVVLGMGEGI